ncbi:hypothetical protein RM533_13275 [Croceicoccus sp. F390]|uniref:Uncharacterized protein n=1 Tax=Croceicoccus esteveae TaxID=3075597 RepID=A0ABU2ZKK4_9SPHN|nr:hypothetical protein [Croceicoccus sp. F390]MDT0577137.1 hypothetical protein [Croceicoccus sp. F390]
MGAFSNWISSFSYLRAASGSASTNRGRERQQAHVDRIRHSSWILYCGAFCNCDIQSGGDGFRDAQSRSKAYFKNKGRDEEVSLTFRMFLSHMFSYLTALSFVAVFLFVAAELLAPSAKVFLNKVPDELIISTIRVSVREACNQLLSGGYLFLSFWFAAKIVLTTMIGLYFLAERIHRPNA